MDAGVDTVDGLGLVLPFALYFLVLWVWYFWEGKREETLRNQYEEEMSDG